MEERDLETPERDESETSADVEAHKRVPKNDEPSDEESGDVEGHRFVTKTVPPKSVPS